MEATLKDYLPMILGSGEVVMSSSHRWWRLGVAILLGISAPVRAQRGAIGLFAGYYRPFGHFDAASVYAASLPVEPSDLRGFAGGGVGQLLLGRRFGIEGQAAVVHSTVPAVTTPGGIRGPTNASVDFVTLEGEYDISPTPERYRVWLNAGPAFVRHGGDAYAQYGSPTSVGGAAGVGLIVPMGRQLNLATSLTTLWYIFDLAMAPELQRNPGRLQHGAQRDAMLQVGLRWGHF
jgi:hypothetical protein